MSDILLTASVGVGQFSGRLQLDSATQISLQRYAGMFIEIGGESVQVLSAGMTLSNTAHLISSTGTDSGGGPAVNTVYYVYVSNSAASFSPRSIRLSATAYMLVNGVRYLGNAANALNWRFVGWIKTVSNAGVANFADSISQRFVVNYYNRILKNLQLTPGYTNGGGFVSFTFTNTSWAEVNGGVGSKGEFISNGEDHVAISAYAMVLNSTGDQDTRMGIGLDSATRADVACDRTQKTGADDAGTIAAITVWAPAEGYHFIDFLNNVTGGTGTWFADFAQNGGGSPDPRASMMSALVSV